MLFIDETLFDPKPVLVSINKFKLYSVLKDTSLAYDDAYHREMETNIYKPATTSKIG